MVFVCTPYKNEEKNTGMTSAQLKASRKELGLNRVQMAKQLRTPYRTYVDWERGVSRIPGICAVAVELLVKKDQWVMQAILEKVGRAPTGGDPC